jgi:hypothetical protein
VTAARRREALVASSFLTFAAAGPAGGGGLELGIHAGPAVPSYQQSFRYDPGPVSLPIAGVTLQQTGTFGIDAEGGVALGASVALTGAVLGLEARLDTADLSLTTQAGQYEVRADLPPPLPDATTSLTIGGGPADLERVRPLSLNLRLRTPGPVALSVSGGVSYLPSLRVNTTQTVGLGVTGIGGGGRLDVATLALRAEVTPQDEDEGRLGVNLGAGLRVRLGPRVALTGEVRAFRFREQTLTWERADSRALSPLEAALLAEVRARLPPVEFSPTFYQGTVGLALMF